MHFRIARNLGKPILVVAALCAAAMSVKAQQQQTAPSLEEQAKALSSKPTPQTPDGHPNLSGRCDQISAMLGLRFVRARQPTRPGVR